MGPTPSCPEAPPCTPVLLTHAEGDHRPGPLHHQDQDHRSPREEVLRLDRRLHPGLPVHLPADVDLQAGVRRVRPLHRPQEVLLSASQFLINKQSGVDMNKKKKKKKGGGKKKKKKKKKKKS